MILLFIIETCGLHTRIRIYPFRTPFYFFLDQFLFLNYKFHVIYVAYTQDCYKAFSILKKITWQSHCLWVSFKAIPVVQKKDNNSYTGEVNIFRRG